MIGEEISTGQIVVVRKAATPEQRRFMMLRGFVEAVETVSSPFGTIPSVLVRFGSGDEAHRQWFMRGQVEAMEDRS